MSGRLEQKQRVHIFHLDLAKEITHGIRVSNLAFQVGCELQLSKERCRELAVAGFLHDVGKLELNRYLYGKEEDTLTIEELKYVRMHPELSARIMMENGYSRELAEWVYCHHENFDGSGYPRNLTGEEIPLEARILRVCDVFAALTSERAYRGAFDVDTAIDLMIEESRYYDVKVFLAFLNVIHGTEAERLLEDGGLEQTFTQIF